MAETTVDTTKLKHHPYLTSIDDTIVGPSKEAPAIEADTELHECLIYENGGKEAVASYLAKNNNTITLNVMDIDWAIALLAEFKVGDDVYAASRKKTITFTPIVGEGATEKTLAFTNCYLQPGLSYTPTAGECLTAKLVFKALPDPTTKKTFTYV